MNDTCYTKGFRIRYKIFNELEFTKTAIVGRDANFARMKQARIVVIPNIDYVSISSLAQTQVLHLNRIGWNSSRIIVLFFKSLPYKKKVKHLLRHFNELLE